MCSSVRTAWVQKIKAASEQFIETEKKKREKAYQGMVLGPLWFWTAVVGLTMVLEPLMFFNSLFDFKYFVCYR